MFSCWLGHDEAGNAIIANWGFAGSNPLGSETLWNAASRYLHANLPKGTKSLPIAEWEKEYATLSGQRTAEYAKLKETRAEVAELHNIRKCVDIALKADQPEQTRTRRHEQER